MWRELKFGHNIDNIYLSSYLSFSEIHLSFITHLLVIIEGKVLLIIFRFMEAKKKEGVYKFTKPAMKKNKETRKTKQSKTQKENKQHTYVLT